jgi:very-short-patch-repair endonuclease
MDPLQALVALGGAARFVQLLAVGVTKHSLSAAVAAGTVQRVVPGLCALPTCSRARLAAAGVGGVLSCLDAAAEHGLTVLRPDTRVHVRAPRGSERSWPATEVHRIGPRRPGGRLDLVAALVSASPALPCPSWSPLLDEAVRLGRCTRAELSAGGPGRDPVWRRVVDLADARAMSGLESLARVEIVEALRASGVLVETQVLLRGIGFVDLLVDGWIIVETDGFAFHADRTSYRRDRRRDAAAARSGYAHLRFTYEDVIAMRGEVAAAVLEVRERGRPPFWQSLRAEPAARILH